MKRASQADRDYFARIAAANAALDDGVVPQSLDEMFDRLDTIRRRLGPLAQPGITSPGDGDLVGHLNYLARMRAVGKRGTQRA